MAELDVLELQKSLKKERLVRMLKDKRVLTLLGACGIQLIPIFLINDNVTRSLSAFAIGAEITIIRHCYRSEGIKDEAVIIEKLRETEIYKECKEEYNAYIKEVASLIRDTGIKSSKEAVQYLQFLMEEGFFAPNKKHQYKKYAYCKEYLAELCGAKVLSGTSVCRHMSSFFVDVLSELNYTAANLSVITTNNDPVKLVKRGIPKWTHAVTAISEEGKMYLFDPTCGMFSSLPKDISFEEIESIFVSQAVTEEEKKYYIMNPDSFVINYGRATELTQVLHSKPSQITKEELEYIRNKVSRIFRGNITNQFAFYFKNEAQRRDITQKVKELSPYSDKRIESWKVSR